MAQQHDLIVTQNELLKELISRIEKLEIDEK